MQPRSLWFLFALSSCLAAQVPPRAGGGALPVCEVTVFKDGHAYVLREAPLAPDGHGQVVLDELPVPVLGTFWPYASDGATIVSAKAGRDTVASEVAAMDFRQVARANTGKDVVVVTADKERIEGKLLGVPSRQTVPVATDGELLMLQTASGTRILQLGQVRDLEVRGEFTGRIRSEEARERLLVQVAGGGPNAKVGVMYVQHGLRWIPAYRLDVDGAGGARVQLEATLVNDLIDLDQAIVHLVVGVPKFEFAGLVDPISLQQEVAQVAANVRDASRFANMLSNSLRTQSMGGPADMAQQGPTPEVAGSETNEDLFVFSLRNVTLKRGERMVLPIAACDLRYRDVYTLKVPFAPPMEIRQGLQGNQVIDLARELAAPKAVHVLRLENTSKSPLTTAPALVLSQGRVLAQGRMRYTPVGRETDLEINVAIDVGVTCQENETGRQDNVVHADGTYGRIDLAGAIDLRNDKKAAIEIEVSRRVLGLVDAVAQGGSKAQLDLVQLWEASDRPAWWGWWGWPHWWFRWNGFGEFRWTVKVEPGATARLEANWHYFWR